MLVLSSVATILMALIIYLYILIFSQIKLLILLKLPFFTLAIFFDLVNPFAAWTDFFQMLII